MVVKRLNRRETLARLSDEWSEDLLPAIREAVEASGRKVVVLDDDPTGTQTVHDIPVLTEWKVEALCSELTHDLPAFYLLTNSRSLPLTEAQSLNAKIGRNLREASRITDREFVVISRSDSTLRGHFPGEVESLVGTLHEDFDAWLVIPFFLEGQRYTIDDVHWVAEGEWLIPAGETPYARDATFGYRASDLREWVEEKTEGRVPANTVAAISVNDIRVGGPERVAEKLKDLPQDSVCVVNSASMRDMEVFVLGLLRAEAQGRRFLYRTAASFVRVRAGLSSRPLLTRAELGFSDAGGELFIVGSHVPKTTKQVEHLLDQPGVIGVEIDVHALLDEHQPAEIERVAEIANQALRRGDTVVAFTSRELVTGDDADTSLSIGQHISESVVAIVRAITERPRYLLAKGGITSSDVATDALEVKRAMVLGQILPGVPVWELGPDSCFPSLVYIVFPGNVGDVDALAEVAANLNSEKDESDA